ncbi:hypothetical protein BGZ76_004674 [Entomortierella beljakovae]|nr:hypothetical protein BGZ76_004674 [Entomortierella beljakovae]
MNQFTLTAVLDTPEPYTIEFLGAPSGVTHNVTGTMTLHTQKTLQLKQLSIAFIGQVKSEPFNIDKVEHSLIDSQKVYAAGEHKFPFQLSIPGDIAVSDSSKLYQPQLLWEYLLVMSATPSGFISRRKEFKQKLKLERVHVEPSSAAPTRFSIGRENQIDSSFYLSKFVHLGQNKLNMSFYLHPYSQKYCVKEIQVYAFQNEKADVDIGMVSTHNRGKRHIVEKESSSGLFPSLKAIGAHIQKIAISETVTVTNPNHPDLATTWGRETPVDIEITLNNTYLLQSEILSWTQITHGISVTLVFVEENQKPLVTKAPFTIIQIMKNPLSRNMYRSVVDGDGGHNESGLPEYGEEMDGTTLLDSNTHRLNNRELYNELYPERGELVPDVVDDLPPTYEREVEQPEPYTQEKQSQQSQQSQREE